LSEGAVDLARGKGDITINVLTPRHWIWKVTDARIQPHCQWNVLIYRGWVQVDDKPISRVEHDRVIEAYKRHIDRSLLRENLRLTVEERFKNLHQLQVFAGELRRARQRGGG
jgi:hypothetical protein